ncbi:unnamed protein product, partial [Ectocarpus fasciculatus]
MRLFKPPMYLSPPLPQLRIPLNMDETTNLYSESDFALSNFLLLPDNFGDIYLGEKFSAYVSVVNGTADTTFSPVNMSVKLQSTITTYELTNVRPGATGMSAQLTTVRPGECLDWVVSHPITMMGSHSLKVFVDYVDPYSGEQKTLKKFYKFSVLNPLLVSSTALDLGNKYVVQSQITNCTRSLLHIEEV